MITTLIFLMNEVFFDVGSIVRKNRIRIEIIFVVALEIFQFSKTLCGECEWGLKEKKLVAETGFEPVTFGL